MRAFLDRLPDLVNAKPGAVKKVTTKKYVESTGADLHRLSPTCARNDAELCLTALYALGRTPGTLLHAALLAALDRTGAAP